MEFKFTKGEKHEIVKTWLVEPVLKRHYEESAIRQEVWRILGGRRGNLIQRVIPSPPRSVAGEESHSFTVHK